MSRVAELKIVPAREEDEDAVFRFLLGSFFVDEPLNSVVRSPPKQDEWKPLSYVKSGYSFIAYAKNDDGEETIAGVVINSVQLRDDGGDASPAEPAKSKIRVLLAKLEEMADIWSRIQSDRVFSVVILSVSSGHRRLSIGRRLLEESLRKAVSSGLSHAVVECSSFYSARMVEKLGFERVCEIRYEDHRDENGDVIFKIGKPHEEIVKFMKALPVGGFVQVLLGDFDLLHHKGRTIADARCTMRTLYYIQKYFIYNCCSVAGSIIAPWFIGLVFTGDNILDYLDDTSPGDNSLVPLYGKSMARAITNKVATTLTEPNPVK